MKYDLSARTGINQPCGFWIKFHSHFHLRCWRPFTIPSSSAWFENLVLIAEQVWSWNAPAFSWQQCKQTKKRLTDVVVKPMTCFSDRELHRSFLFLHFFVPFVKLKNKGEMLVVSFWAESPWVARNRCWNNKMQPLSRKKNTVTRFCFLPFLPRGPISANISLPGATGFALFVLCIEKVRINTQIHVAASSQEVSTSFRHKWSGQQKNQNILHQTSNSRAGEGIPLQQVPDSPEADRDRTRTEPHRETDKNLVPKPVSKSQHNVGCLHNALSFKIIAGEIPWRKECGESHADHIFSFFVQNFPKHSCTQEKYDCFVGRNQ